MKNNICLLTDSYKLSHFRMYPPGTEYLYSYFERLDVAGISYYGMLGNDDCQAVLANWQELVRTYPKLHDLTEERISLAGGLTICGCNYIPDPPFRLKDWCVLDTRDYVRPSQHPDPIISQGDSFELIHEIDSQLSQSF